MVRAAVILAAYFLVMFEVSASFKLNFDNLISVTKFLKQNKYLDKWVDTAGKNYEDLLDLTKVAVSMFNGFYNTGQGGEITEQTIEEMKKPRCANTDVETPYGSSPSHRVKRFTLLNKAKYLWNDPRTPYPITIGFKNYYRGIHPNEQEQIALECATIWAEVSGISFKLIKDGIANIHISFEEIEGDDGEGGTVGEGLSPTPFKDIPSSFLRLDSREKWIPRYSPTRSGLSMKETLCHEMGHTLSLGHSNDKSSLMYPSVGEKNHDVRLSKDDITGIQSLYGKFDGKTVEREDTGSGAPVVFPTFDASAPSTGSKNNNCRKSNNRNGQNCRNRSNNRKSRRNNKNRRNNIKNSRRSKSSRNRKSRSSVRRRT